MSDELENRIARLEALNKENFELAQEAGKLANKALKEIIGICSDIEIRLDDLEQDHKADKPQTTFTAADILALETPVLVKIENGEIGLYDEQLYKFQYWIELTRIKTPRDLLEWVHHLTGKNWVTNDHISQFIEALVNYRNWTLYKGV